MLYQHNQKILHIFYGVNRTEATTIVINAKRRIPQMCQPPTSIHYFADFFPTPNIAIPTIINVLMDMDTNAILTPRIGAASP